MLISGSVACNFILLNYCPWPLRHTLYRKGDKERDENRLLIPPPINASMALFPHVCSISFIVPPLSRLATNAPAMKSEICLPFKLLFQLPSSPIFVLLKGI
jgi:hypothetical protein